MVFYSVDLRFRFLHVYGGCTITVRDGCSLGFLHTCLHGVSMGISSGMLSSSFPSLLGLVGDGYRFWIAIE